MEIVLSENLASGVGIQYSDDVLFDASGDPGISVFEFRRPEVWAAQGVATLNNRNINTLGAPIPSKMGTSQGAQIPDWQEAEKAFSFTNQRLISDASFALQNPNYWVGAWIKIGPFINNVVKSIAANTRLSSNSGQFILGLSNNRPRAFHYHTDGVAAIAHNSANALTQGNIYHIACSMQVENSAAVYRLYVNGEIVSVATDANTTIAQSNKLFVIGGEDAGALLCQGDIIYRVTVENLTVSNNIVNDQIAREIKEYSGFFGA